MNQIADYEGILITAPFYFGYVWASDKFCKKYLGASPKNERWFRFLSFAGWLVLDIASIRHSVLYIFSVMLYAAFFMGLVMLLFQSDREKRFLAASMLVAVIKLVGNFCESLLSCLVLFFRHTVKEIPEPFLGEWEIGFIGCASYCFVILAVCWMSRRLEPVFCGKRGKWYVILAVPLLMFIAVIDVAGWGATGGIMVRSGGSLGLYYDQIFSHAEFVVLSLLSMFAIGFYVFGMERIYEGQEKNSQYHSQIAVYKMLAEQYSQSERLRHDMRNHIIALSGLFQSKEWEKMGNYLKNMEDIGLECGGEVTGNKAVDALLYDKRKWAKRNGVEWECDIQIPAARCVNEFDLCVLFGNLLDNALEACERLQSGESRFVSIKAKTVKKCFLLEVKNSMDSTEKYTEGFTSKENFQGHGIGLLNVRDVVDRYNGVLNIETKDAVFVISILMPFSNTVHDGKQAV